MTNPARKGACSEAAAIAWLLHNGFEVFRGCSPVGLVDLVAMNNGAVYLFDVKTGNGRLSSEQIALGVVRIVVDWTEDGRAHCCIPDSDNVALLKRLRTNGNAEAKRKVVEL